MKINKKIIMGTLTSALTILAPVSTAISCSKEDNGPGIFMEHYSDVVNLDTVKKDGWSLETAGKDGRGGKNGRPLLKNTPGENGESHILLSDDFVDYLVDKVNSVDLTKSFKVFYMDLRYFGLDELGNYFIKRINNIKREEKLYTFPRSDVRVKGSSGIILNIINNKFTDSKDESDLYDDMKEMIKGFSTIREIIYSKAVGGNDGMTQLWSERDWLGFSLSKKSSQARLIMLPKKLLKEAGNID